MDQNNMQSSHKKVALVLLSSIILLSLILVFGVRYGWFQGGSKKPDFKFVENSPNNLVSSVTVGGGKPNFWVDKNNKEATGAMFVIKNTMENSIESYKNEVSKLGWTVTSEEVGDTHSGLMFINKNGEVLAVYFDLLSGDLGVAVSLNVLSKTTR